MAYIHKKIGVRVKKLWKDLKINIMKGTALKKMIGQHLIRKSQQFNGQF